jgi:hydroxyethylthiazole kinase
MLPSITVYRMVSSSDVWSAYADVRSTNPLVHNITNYVSMDIAANVLLAAGASPAMVHAVDEAADFSGISSALVVNIGTLSPPWVEGMRLAVAAAKSRGTPWVLDPVGVGATPYRTKTAAELLDLRPTVVRCNASEALALAGATFGGKGVDSTAGSDEAHDAARELARATGGVVAVTGVVDHVTDGAEVISVGGGHELMPKVTALGCSVSALVGAFCAVREDRMLATASALAIVAVAGQRAGRDATGPGSFRVRFLDELYTMNEATVSAEVDLR